MAEVSFNIDEYLYDLAKLVNIDSFSSDTVGIKKATDFFVAKCHTHNLSYDKIKFSSKYGEFMTISHGKAPYDFCLSCHIDTVFPQGTAKDRPFTIKNNMAYGPGVADMKSGLLLAFYLFLALKKHSNKSICLAINPVEEIGVPLVNPILEKLAKNSRCALIFEPSRPTGNLIIKRKGIKEYVINITGKSAHAGNEPQNGKNANLELAKWIIALEGFNDYEHGITLNVGKINGGIANNVISEYASMTLETRFWQQEAVDKLVALLKELKNEALKNGFKVKINNINTKFPLQPNEAIAKYLHFFKDTAKSLGQSVKETAVGALSDGNAMTHYVPVLDGMGPKGSFYHTAQEVLEINTIEPRFRLLFKFINSFRG